MRTKVKIPGLGPAEEAPNGDIIKTISQVTNGTAAAKIPSFILHAYYGGVTTLVIVINAAHPSIKSIKRDISRMQDLIPKMNIKLDII